MKIRNGLSEKEAGKLGAAKSKIISAQQKLQRIEEYNKNPKICKKCGSSLPYEKRRNIFCSSACAASYNNKQRVKKAPSKRKKLQKTTVITQPIKLCTPKPKHIKKKKAPHLCKYCGSEKCIHPEICKKYQIFKSLIKFGFDYSVVGTNKLYDEYYRVRNIIQEFYNAHNSNSQLLKTIFNYTSGGANFQKLLKSLDIKSKSYSKASIDSYINGNNTPPKCRHYHECWHVTWDNKEVFLRSSYELDYAQELDALHIQYNVEPFRIKYFDTVQQIHRCAIPDFYLPNTNEIIEIKSLWTILGKVQEIKDKFNEYVNLGYIPKLVLEHKEFSNIDFLTEEYIQQCKHNNNKLI